jgi:hypothetical protein
MSLGMLQSQCWDQHEFQISNHNSCLYSTFLNSGFFIQPDPSSLILVLGPTQPLKEISTGQFSRGGGGRSKRRQVHKIENLSAICEPIV